jgi:nucleoside-diphosphate-sugar epimerase
MDRQKVFITGGSGFLGSAIVAHLVKLNYSVMATKRPGTNLFRCKDFYDKVTWVDTDNPNYKDEVVAFAPSVIIHAAWSGVTSKERLDWAKQLQNFDLLANLLEIAQSVNPQKFIVLGSQAEYGVINAMVDEGHSTEPQDAYATCKLAMQNIIKTFCNQHSINWYWLRVFSVFGPGEADNWFLPWVIINQLNNNDTDLTLCEQQYDYLYINDFAGMIITIVKSLGATSGVYNICSGKPRALKTIVEGIKDVIGGTGKINFGAIPYRQGQSMQISGNNSKYNVTFGETIQTDFSLALMQTISYYKGQNLS